MGWNIVMNLENTIKQGFTEAKAKLIPPEKREHNYGELT